MSFLCVIVITNCKGGINYIFLMYFPILLTLSPFEPQRKSNIDSLFSMTKKIADRVIPSTIQQTFAT